MNRAERRANGNKGKVKTFNLTQEQIDDIRNQCIQIAREQAFLELFAYSIRVIHDKYPLLMKREGRVATFAHLLWDTWEDHQNGYFTTDDLRKTIKEETGLDFFNLTQARLFK